MGHQDWTMGLGWAWLDIGVDRGMNFGREMVFSEGGKKDVWLEKTKLLKIERVCPYKGSALGHMG